MQEWLIYLPVIASLLAVGGAYAFLKASATQLRAHREAMQAAQVVMPRAEKVREALRPVETALEVAVSDLIVGAEESRAARAEAEARPYL